MGCHPPHPDILQSHITQDRLLTLQIFQTQCWESLFISYQRLCSYFHPTHCKHNAHLRVMNLQQRIIMVHGTIKRTRMQVSTTGSRPLPCAPKRWRVLAVLVAIHQSRKCHDSLSHLVQKLECHRISLRSDVAAHLYVCCFVLAGHGWLRDSLSLQASTWRIHSDYNILSNIWHSPNLLAIRGISL